MHPANKSFKKRFRLFLGGYLRLILGILALIFGLVFMFIPFIPLGYVLVFVAILLLSTYIPPFKRLLNKLKKRDKNGILRKYERKMRKIEQSLKGERQDRASE